MGLTLILLLAAHAALAGGFPRCAQAVVMSPAGARSRAEELAQMKQLMAIGVAAAVSAGASAQTTVQWRVEDGGNGHWYQLVDDGIDHTWHQARDWAAASSGHLATLSTEQEDSFVRSSFMPGIAYSVLGPWLGGFQDHTAGSYAEPGGGWAWVTGERWTWALWDRPDDPEPNQAQCGPEDFLHLAVDVSAGRWNDLGYGGCSGTGNRGFIVEYDADCNADGIVDFGQVLAGELADANANNIPDCCENGTLCGCPGDTNSDTTVDGIDLATVLTRWGQSAAKFPEADCNRDGVIDGSDLAIVLGSWGVCP